ncbi:MAG: TolC family protein [Gemmataceae bacterium]
MLGSRPLLGSALLTLVVGLASATAQDKAEPPASLSFLPGRVDGGATLLPADSAPAAGKKEPPKTLPDSLLAAPMPAAPPKAGGAIRATLGLPVAGPEKEPAPEKKEALPAPARPPVTFAVSLERLWELTLINQPELREAAAKFAEARGRQIQAGKYLNPVFTYEQGTIGARDAGQGDISLMIRQEIITAGKFRLDKTIAATQSASAALELTQKQFELLTRVRRGYFDYLTLTQENYFLDTASKTLEERVKQARILMKKAGVISKTEVQSIELLLEEVRLEQIKVRAGLRTAWGQLAADVGLPGLPQPTALADRPRPAPLFPLDYIEDRVRDNSDLRQARIDADAAALQVRRARAEAVPNFTIGAGYSNPNATGSAAGANISFEAPLPVWDRKQGRIRETEATYTRLSAAVYSLELRYLSQAREAFGRYTTARENLKQLNERNLPVLKSRVELIKQAYQAKAENVNFNDVFQAEQALIKTQADAYGVRRDLWRAIADLEGLMQMSLEEELHSPLERDPETAPAPKK